MSTSNNRQNTLLVGSSGYIGSNVPFACITMDLKEGKDFLAQRPRKFQTLIFLAAMLESEMASALYNERLYHKLDEWLIAYPDTHVIYASSAAVYGESTIAQKENSYLRPVNLYGESKLAGEYHVREYKNHTVLRFANVYGKMGGQPGHGVTELFQAGGKIIYGDGNQTRDFVNIVHIWKAISLARKYPEYWQGVFNISTSEPSTINEWFRLHGRGEPEYRPAREGDIFSSLLDNAKMNNRIALCR